VARSDSSRGAPLEWWGRYDPATDLALRRTVEPPPPRPLATTSRPLSNEGSLSAESLLQTIVPRG
jgi:hypothetical protein